MPKLKTIRFVYITKKDADSIPFDVDVSVSQDGQFYCSAEQIPEIIRKAFDSEFQYIEKISEPTLDGLKKEVEGWISKFEELLKEQGKTKVIKYRIFIQGDLTPTLSGNSSRSRRHNDLDDCKYGLGVDWHIAYKHKIMGRTSYTNENGTSFYHDDYDEMVWTKDREVWFEKLEQSILLLAKNVDKFFKNKSGKQLAKFIDSKYPLLFDGRKK